MELVEDLSEILDNLLYLESKLNSKNPQDCEEANNLIKKGICFVKYVIDNRIVFAPSRFIGYKNNSLRLHYNSKTKHGSNTNNRIKKILNQIAKSNKEVDIEYFEFCGSYGILPNKEGSFGTERKYWDLGNLNINIYGDVELPEGKKKLITHYKRERNPRLRQIAINNFLVKHKKLFCEACEFNFEEKYGKLGQGFIECHHTIPLSKMKTNHRTKIEDLVLLCSNCHRMIHKPENWLTVEELKKVINKNS